ncbi:hypothetical protein N7465_003664 [Penicillium sp. CMV-2018d]|nr:hypothetical protein N7465_003664 [Penicillium sp. CMV-2018d]
MDLEHPTSLADMPRDFHIAGHANLLCIFSFDHMPRRAKYLKVQFIITSLFGRITPPRLAHIGKSSVL